MAKSKRKRTSEPTPEPRKRTAQVTRASRKDATSDSKNRTGSHIVTRGKAAAALKSSRTAVLHTFELLENILVHLPMRQLFTIGRVCRYFKETVEQSPALQTKMFLRCTEAPVSAHPEFDEQERIQGFVSIDFDVLPKEAAYNAKLNDTICYQSGTIQMVWSLDVELHLHMLDHVQSAIMGYSGGQSWKQMYITNPPCTIAFDVEVLFNDGDDGVHFIRKDHIVNESGAQLGDLFNDLSAFRAFERDDEQTLEEFVPEALEVGIPYRWEDPPSGWNDLDIQLLEVSFKMKGLEKDEIREIARQPRYGAWRR